MLQAERHKIICTHVQQQGSALVTELSVLCQVSQETIRRDLTVLQKTKTDPQFWRRCRTG